MSPRSPIRHNEGEYKAVEAYEGTIEHSEPLQTCLVIIWFADTAQVVECQSYVIPSTPWQNLNQTSLGLGNPTMVYLGVNLIIKRSYKMYSGNLSALIIASAVLSV